jgi:hypothetical protein
MLQWLCGSRSISEGYGQCSTFSRVRRLHDVQRGDIDGEPLVIDRGLLVVGELVSDLAGQVPGPEIRRPDSGSLNTSVASCPGVVLAVPSSRATSLIRTLPQASMQIAGASARLSARGLCARGAMTRALACCWVELFQREYQESDRVLQG